MTEWKAGDWAMVKVTGVHQDTVAIERPGTSRSAVIGDDCLHPLPAPLTGLEQAVVEAAVAWRNYSVGSSNGLACAVDALIAARTPPDPLAIAKDALDQLSKLGNGEHVGNSWGNEIAIRALAAIAAVEARKS